MRRTRLTRRIIAALLALALSPAPPAARAAQREEGGVSAFADTGADDRDGSGEGADLEAAIEPEETSAPASGENLVRKTLYTVGNTSHEGGAATPKGNGQDCQHLDVWVPKDGTFRIRQADTSLNQSLQLRMWADDSQIEFNATIPADGTWLTVTAKGDCVPFVYSIHRQDGKQPVVEYEADGRHTLPVYHHKKDDEAAFFRRWDELDAPFAVYESEVYATFLIPARDKGSNRFGSLDDLLTYYDNMIGQYNAFSGLSKTAAEVWNEDSGTRFFIKADAHGVGAAYYHPHKTAVNSPSIAGYLMYGWGNLHEVGHGYNTVGFNSAEIWNNVLAHYYQVSTLGKGGWLDLTTAGRAKHDRLRSTMTYDQIREKAEYAANLYFWVNMLDKLGPQETSAYAYRLYRGNKANGRVNLSGFDFYADAYTRGSGYNVTPWFEMWGIPVSADVKESLIQDGAYQNVYPLRNLVSTDETAETIRKALGLVSIYSLAETRELRRYWETAPVEGTLSITLDAVAFEALTGQTIRITDGVDTVREVTVDGQTLTVQLPIGLYNVLVPTAKGTDYVRLSHRTDHAAVCQDTTTAYSVTGEKTPLTDSFADWTMALGSTYGATANHCVATTNMASLTMRIVNVARNPHTGFGKGTYSSITVYDGSDPATRTAVYQRIHTGSGNTASDDLIDLRPGYQIELFHAEPFRGMFAYSALVGSVFLLNTRGDADDRSAVVSAGKTVVFEVTEKGIQIVQPAAKANDPQADYARVLSAYMDLLKDSNPRASFQDPEKLPEEKARVNAAFQTLTPQQQTAFQAAYAGFYPFDTGVREMVIAPIAPQIYTGSPIQPPLDIRVGEQILSPAQYRAQWLCNTAVGTATVRIYGLEGFDDCTGSANFIIQLPPGLSALTVECEYTQVEFSAGAKRPFATVSAGERVLIPGVDYILGYADNTNVGTATVTATGLGSYRGLTGTATFQILPKIYDLTAVASPSRVNAHGGDAVTTDITVLLGKRTLSEGADYTVRFENNTAVGTATAIVEGAGNYAGSNTSVDFYVTEPIDPEPVGGTPLSGWRYVMNGYTASGYCQMTFDMENGRLTVRHGRGKPHVLIAGVYASIAVYDTTGSRSYSKRYIGNQDNYAPEDIVPLGSDYIVELTFSEPQKNGSKIVSTASEGLTLAPSKSARYRVTARGLQEITADGSVSQTDMAAQYDQAIRAYMDRLKAAHPAEDFRDETKLAPEKALVERSVALLTPEELAAFTADYAGLYPFAAAAVYTLAYDWGAVAPGDKILPVNGNTYETEAEARSAVDTAFTKDTVSHGDNGGVSGTWRFSGWDGGTLSGTTLIFRGSWAFVPAAAPTPEPEPERQEETHSIRLPSRVVGGDVALTPRYAKPGTLVTLTVTPQAGYELSSLSILDARGGRLAVTPGKNGAYTFTMPNGQVEVKPLFRSATQSVFTDVSSQSYYFDAVKWAVQNNITQGITPVAFHPDAPCTRAQIVTFLWRSAGSPTPKTGHVPFPDVPETAYYYQAVLWAMENGITAGTSDGRFSPDGTCTRSQGVTFLHRSKGTPSADGSGFADVDSESFYAGAVAWAAQNGITGGTENGLFSPDAPCTRAQIVTFLYRAAQ